MRCTGHLASRISRRPVGRRFQPATKCAQGLHAVPLSLAGCRPYEPRVAQLNHQNGTPCYDPHTLEGLVSAAPELSAAKPTAGVLVWERGHNTLPRSTAWLLRQAEVAAADSHCNFAQHGLRRHYRTTSINRLQWRQQEHVPMEDCCAVAP